MIVEDRDATFWSEVYEHPMVKPHVGLGFDLDIPLVIANPQITPLRSENGGFLFVRLDGVGRLYELHTMYLPQAWGTREIPVSAAEAFALMFERGAHLITTYEVAGNPRSQPPRSFRFEPAGGFAFTPLLNVELRTWILTQRAWEASPARLRMTARCH